MLRWLFACSLLLALCTRAHAQQLDSNRYTIDLFTSPVLGPGRIVGMGGAHIAIASGIDGAAYNPAGYAERLEKEIDFFAFDITGGIWLGGLFQKNDFDNNGSRRGVSSTDTYQVTLGTRMQFAHFGVGATGLARVYTLRDDQHRAISELNVLTVRTGAGYAFLDGALVLGGGLVFSGFDLSAQPSDKNLVSFRGFGGEVGALFRPKRERYRLGTTFRTPISSRPQNGDEVGDDGLRRAETLVLPQSVYVPWEAGVGFAYQFGERRSNVPWRNTRTLRRELREQILSGSYQPPPTYGEEEYETLPYETEKAVETAVENYREGERRFRRNQPRRYILLAADLIVYGTTARGQSMSAFLLQKSERSGAHISYGVRVGMESEVWQDRMKVRVGSYLEPSRISRKYYRPHGTLGLEARLFDFWRWSARGTATMDVAPRYFNWGIAMGLWW